MYRSRATKAKNLIARKLLVENTMVLDRSQGNTVSFAGGVNSLATLSEVVPVPIISHMLPVIYRIVSSHHYLLIQ